MTKKSSLLFCLLLLGLVSLFGAGGILTLAYIKLPPALGIPEQKLDPTFIASVFTGVLLLLVSRQQRKQEKVDGNGGGISKADMERLIAAAAQTAPAQTIRIEQAPIQIGFASTEKPYQM